MDHYLKRELYELVRTDPAVFEFLQAGSLDGLWYWDVTNPAEEWLSPRFKEVFGYSDDEVPNKASWWQEHIHPDDLDLVLENARRHCEDPSHPYDQVVRYRHKNGSTVWIRCRGLAIRDEQGRATRILGTHTDVTELVEATEEARRLNAELERRVQERTAKLSEQSLRNATLAAIVDSSEDAILQKDLDGTIRSWNRGAERMYGYSAEEAIGKSIDIIVPEERRRELRAILDTIARGERVDHLETRRVTKDGRQLWVSVTVSPVFGPDGALLGASAIARNMTQRRQAQRRLVQLNAKLEHYAEELERSNTHLQEFAYVASHDLREPLRMVRSFCTLLGEKYGDRLDAEGREFIEFAIDGARRMQEMIESLLEYSRVGSEELSPAALDVADLLADATHALRMKIEETGARITHDPLPVVRADGGLIPHVFQNLLANALKFRRDGVPPRVHVSAVRDGERWVISIRDNGIGIDEHCLDSVFEIFRRLHSREAYEGTGIGLALCKRIVERHGGEIRVDSTLGHGSTFSFDLPADHAQSPHDSALEDEQGLAPANKPGAT